MSKWQKKLEEEEPTLAAEYCHQYSKYIDQSEKVLWTKEGRVIGAVTNILGMYAWNTLSCVSKTKFHPSKYFDSSYRH